MRLGDVLVIRRIPPVISGADIRSYRTHPNSPDTAAFLSGYLGVDSRSRHALHTVLSSLSGWDTGGAFWLNGVFGSGKSHLLGVLTLLGEGAGHEVFASAHPDCAAYLKSFSHRFCVHISLDEFNAGQLGLEEIFWRELQRQWARVSSAPLQVEQSGSRIEAFTALQGALNVAGYAGLIVCFDELSLFLGGRAHGPLQADAAFLQFLGSHTRRAPLWVFAALQKTIEDISGLESYSLGQIRDRFTLLSLSLTNVTALVEKRLVHIEDEANVADTCASTWLDIECRLPRLDFGPQEWRSTFPFYPATLAVLEGVTGRFFSRTRSATLFCSSSIDLHMPATARVPVEAVWDYFQPELEAHPDLRPLDAVWRAWSDTAEHIYALADHNRGLRVMKYLLLAKIAGQSPTPVQVANALDLNCELNGDGAYDYARFLLERLRNKGSYLAVERGDEPLQDRYAVDLGRRVNETARRHVAAVLETVPVGDSRIAPYNVSCCKSDVLPLANLLEPRSFVTFWQNAPRRVSVEVWNGKAPERIANRVLHAREHGSPEDAVLAILPPFSGSIDVESPIELLEEEVRSALWFWLPRTPTRNEWDVAREAFAAAMVAHDPALADNRRGRAVVDHLNKDAAGREAQLSALASRLLLEGELKLANGAYLEANELTLGSDFSSLLESVGDFAWPHLFARFPEVAPRARLLTPSNADSLCLEILRRPPTEPFFAPSLERLARHIGEPLGVARSTAGRWRIEAGTKDIVDDVLGFLGEGTPLSAVEAHFAKSRWGLRTEQTSILTCALLRSGKVGAYDGQGHELEPSTIGLPLRRSVHYLRPGRLPNSSDWTKLGVLLQELCGLAVGPLSFAEAQKVTAALLEWRENLAQSADLTQARVAQLRRVLHHNDGNWPSFDKAGRVIASIFEIIPERGTPFDVLSRCVQLNDGVVMESITQFHRFETALATTTAPFIAAHGLLTNEEFVASPALAERRVEVLEMLGQGEGAVLDPKLEQLCRELVNAYQTEYESWHKAQNDVARWNSWRRLSQSDEARAVERLATLNNRPFGGEIRDQIEVELAKRCPRDGTLSSGEAVCSSCGLRRGERLSLRDKAEVEALLESELNTLRQLIKDAAVAPLLQRFQSPFLDWDGEPGTLLPLLSTGNLRALDEALVPRKKVQRSTNKLLNALHGCSTFEEMEAAFRAWASGPELLAGGDVVELIQ